MNADPLDRVGGNMCEVECPDHYKRFLPYPRPFVLIGG